MNVKQTAEQIGEEAISLRRDLHKIAELSFEEYKTAAYVADYLEGLGLCCRKNLAKTGVIAFLDAGFQHTLLLRADMDALPVEEQQDVPYCSETNGVMHACGHDAHMAILLATAKCMAEHKEELKTNVLFLFQPGEETDGGAEPMIATGIMDEFHVTCAAGLHVMNDVDAGKIRIKTGELMAAPDDFELTIYGKGGHGAYPHECIDPITLAARIISDFDMIATRFTTSLSPKVISTCVMKSGSVYNVIPDMAYLSGTVRTFDKHLRKTIPEMMEKAIKGVCDIAGATYDFQFNFRYPPLVNHDGMADALEKAISKELGVECVVKGGVPSMGGDDFAYFGEHVPSVYFFLGSGNKKSGITMPLHSSDFQIDESCLKTGIAAYLALAVNDCAYFG